jgi:flagellar basal body-associated protein FliL
MNKRTIKIILLLLLIILLLAAIAYFFWFFKFPGTVMPQVKPPVIETANDQNGLTSATSTPAVKQAEIPKTTTAQKATDEEVERLTLVKMASSFAERLGSYSNQENYANIINLKIFMTVSMQKWADNYVAAAKKSNPYSGAYQGLTTHAVTSEIKNFDSAKGVADILIHAQKVQSTASSTNNASYTEDLLVTFVKENGQWKVDNAKWLNKSIKN